MVTGRKAVMSGMRPTGRLHLGNYWGALKNWVELQPKYDCFFCVADWHMLTTGYDDTSALQDNIREMVLDWLAAGLDPEKSVVFLQSKVPEHAELALLLSMITPLSWLENNPTWKEQLQELAKTKETKIHEETKALQKQMSRDLQKTVNLVDEPVVSSAKDSLRTHGFLGYPVLQAADILPYDAQLVPVGQDQLPHLELSREIARRFNSIFAKGGEPVLVEPKPLLTRTPKVPGTDGRKMSKSYGNAVDLYETADSLKAKAMGMYTDPTRLKATDPGHPEPCAENPPGCTVFALHKLYSPCAETRRVECVEGKIGCVACKKDLLKSIEGPFAEFRARRESFAKDSGHVAEILKSGSERARKVAGATLARVRKAVRLT